MVTGQESSSRYIYRIDASDRITFVNHNWLRFAVENDAVQLSQENVVGSLIWDHVVGLSTRQLYAELFRSLRGTRTEIAIPFNCDSPTLVRCMTLTLRSLSANAIELEGSVTHLEERPSVPIFDRRVERSGQSVTICSLCRRLRHCDDWLTVGEALGRRRLFTSAPPPRLDESLCPTCEGLAS